MKAESRGTEGGTEKIADGESREVTVGHGAADATEEHGMQHRHVRSERRSGSDELEAFGAVAKRSKRSNRHNVLIADGAGYRMNIAVKQDVRGITGRGTQRRVEIG